MLANGGWDLIRRLKGKVTYTIKESSSSAMRTPFKFREGSSGIALCPVSHILSLQFMQEVNEVTRGCNNGEEATGW